MTKVTRYRIEVTETVEEERDVKEFLKVRDTPLTEDGSIYGYVDVRKRVKEERKVFVGESATCPDIVRLSRMLAKVAP